ncbi:alpha-humulene synthase-like isoform X2 [Carex rostrata]
MMPNLKVTTSLFMKLRFVSDYSDSTVFMSLQDDKGGFCSTVSEDSRGLLSLYNAASLRTDGEDILKEASFFTKERLEYLVHDLEYPLKNQVSRALQVPLPRMMKRLEARWYIDEYKEENPNDIILELATLDFDIVQALHREELRIVSLWWNELNLKENFGYTRDRIVESFFWMTAIYFEPHFSRARIIATKAINLITLLDDTYDIYGTLEECQLLTDAIQRWDRSCAEMFPAEYLKIFYLKCINFVEETEAALEPSEKYRASYLKEMLICFSRACMKDAEWHAQDYSPSFKECLELGLLFSFNRNLCCTILIGIGSGATKEMFQWVDGNPDPIRAIAEVGRLSDDIVSYEREIAVGQVANLVDCYMNEHNVSKEETIIRFNRRIEDGWMQVNGAFLKPSTVLSPAVTERIYNICCSIQFMYNYTADGFTKCANIREFINLLYVEQLSI